MKKLVQGIAFIMFSILLVFAAALDPFLSTFWGGGLQIVLDLLALILGVAGLLRTLLQGDVELVVSPSKLKDGK